MSSLLASSLRVTSSHAGARVCAVTSRSAPMVIARWYSKKKDEAKIAHRKEKEVKYAPKMNDKEKKAYFEEEDKSGRRARASPGKGPVVQTETMGDRFDQSDWPDEMDDNEFYEEIQREEESFRQDEAEIQSQIDDLTMKEVSEQTLQKQREEHEDKMWEQFSTEKFNKEILLQENAAIAKEIKQTVSPRRPSKLLYYSDAEINAFLPEGFAGRLPRVEFKQLEKNKALLMRPEVEDVAEWLDMWKERKFIGRSEDKDYYTILHGPMGVGKSTLLNPIVHWARLSGWLTIFIPDGVAWIGTGHLSRSMADPTCFGQPILAKKWTDALLSVHGDKLKKIPIRTKFTILNAEKGGAIYEPKKGDTLFDLLQYGSKSPGQASDCIWYFRKELNTVWEYPVLLVVDGVNALNSYTDYGDALDPYLFSPQLPAARLTLSKAFRDYRHHGLCNGAVVGTTTAARVMDPLMEKYQYGGMKKPERRMLRTLNLLEIPPLSKEEAFTLSEWYRENGRYIGTVPRQTVDYLWAMSSGIGEDFFKQTATL